MKFLRWLAEEAKAIASVTLYFAAVIVLDQIPLTRWLQGSRGIVELITRSALATAVLVAMLCEKAFESRAEQGDLISALTNVFDHPDMPKLWATALAVGLSFLAYNAFELVRRAIGAKRMVELFLRRNATGA
jgi:hypothetical protein